MNEARIGEGRKSLLTTTITTATSAPAPALAPKMSRNGFEFAAELAVVGAERLVEGVGVGEAEAPEVGLFGATVCKLGVIVGEELGVGV